MGMSSHLRGRALAPVVLAIVLTLLCAGAAPGGLLRLVGGDIVTTATEPGGDAQR